MELNEIKKEIIAKKEQYKKLNTETEKFAFATIDELVRTYGENDGSGNIELVLDDFGYYPPISIGDAEIFVKSVSINSDEELIVNGDDDYNDYSVEVDTLSTQVMLELLEDVVCGIKEN